MHLVLKYLYFTECLVVLLQRVACDLLLILSHACDDLLNRKTSWPFLLLQLLNLILVFTLDFMSLLQSIHLLFVPGNIYLPLHLILISLVHLGKQFHVRYGYHFVDEND